MPLKPHARPDIQRAMKSYLASLTLLIVPIVSSMGMAQVSASNSQPAVIEAQIDQLRASAPKKIETEAGAIFSFRMKKQSDALPLARFGTRDLVILDQGRYWKIIGGVDLNTVPGEYIVYYRDSTDEQDAIIIPMSVLPKSDSVTTVDETQALELSETLARFAAIKPSILDFENTGEPLLPLRTPAANINVSTFGEIHEISNQSVRQSWISFTIDLASPLLAPSNGIVSNAGEALGWYYLVIDHGRGLYSILLTDLPMALALADGVVQGQELVFEATSAIRATSPIQVHWQLVINNDVVDPNALISGKF